MVEAFQQPKGAKWLAERCKELTGKWPTDVVLTHFHGDHVSGSAGFKSDEGTPKMWVTDKTIEMVKSSQQGRASTLLDDLESISSTEKTEVDLGGRSVVIQPFVGHTPSDVIVEVVDPNIVFTGDLFWNRMVPNFRDAKPTSWAPSISSLEREEETKFVPGHGTMATMEDVKLFGELLQVLEDAAKSAHKAGTESTKAAEEFELEGKFKDWYVFSPGVIPFVFSSWYKELEG